MGVPFQHLQRLVSRNGRHLHGVQALLEEPAGRLVPEVVEGEVRQEGGIRLGSLSLAFLLIGFPGAGERSGRRWRGL